MTFHVFIAHSKKDSKLLNKIKNLFRNVERDISGISPIPVILDKPFPKPAAEYFREKIDKCDALFALITDNVLKCRLHFAIVECLFAYPMMKNIYIFKDKYISLPKIFYSMVTWEEYDLSSRNGVKKCLETWSLS